MSTRRGFASNPRFLLFLYMILFSTAILWITYMYGMNCDASNGPPSPISKSVYLELEKLKEKLRRYETPQGESSVLPVIYAITPTYTRPVQKAELVRLSLAFLHVRNFHWIVVEDSLERTTLVANFLEGCGVEYTHLHVKTHEDYQLKENDPSWKLNRGVDQRNAGIDWLLENRVKEGVVYFADDDNTYSLQLFEEMRPTQRVSVWPVGLVGGMRFERPIVSSSGKVTGWYTVWEKSRPFAMDMAGFAINMELFLSRPKARFDIASRRGYVETSLLTSLGVTLDDLEPKADHCSKVYVWHTRTEKPKWKQEERLIRAGQPSDPNIEV